MTPYFRLFSYAMTALGILVLVAISAAVQAQEPRTAVISFDAPTEYIDGTPIAPGTVIEYRVYQGAKGSGKPQVATITGTSTTINTGLQPGETCWQVSAVANGRESDLSNEGCKTFEFPATKAITITVR